MFKRIKEKIKEIQEIKIKRKLEKLFPELPANDWIDKLDESKYNIKYAMNQKTLDRIKSIVSGDILATYNIVPVLDNLLQYGEVMKIYSPKNPEPKTTYGELIYLQKSC